MYFHLSPWTQNQWCWLVYQFGLYDGWTEMILPSCVPPMFWLLGMLGKSWIFFDLIHIKTSLNSKYMILKQQKSHHFFTIQQTYKTTFYYIKKNIWDTATIFHHVRFFQPLVSPPSCKSGSRNLTLRYSNLATIDQHIALGSWNQP